MKSDRSIYLDNAATSWPKPKTVTDEIARFYLELGAAASRGSSSRTSEVDRTIQQCRTEIARLIRAEASQIVFCFNGTDGLNLAINGLVQPNHKVVASVVEHNSVLRPLNEKRSTHQIQLELLECEDGEISLEDCERKLGTGTDICCVSHVSNVTGVIQPIKEIAAICKRHDILLIVDAAQSVGHIEVDFNDLGVDVLVASGHKGLLGPLGTGFLCLSDRAAKRIRPTRLGGTGTTSESIEQPEQLPYKLESGNLNVGGIFGLLAGVRFVAEKSVAKLARHEQELRQKLIDDLKQSSHAHLYGTEKPSTGVLSFNLPGQDAQMLAALLDSAFGIQVRAGLHCSPLIHNHLGTSEVGGTIRVSPGVFNTAEEIEYLTDAIQRLSNQLV